MKYIQFVGEDMSLASAVTKAHEAANTHFKEHPELDILSENVLYTTTVAQKNQVIILLRITEY